MKFLSLCFIVALMATGCSNDDDNNTTVNSTDFYFLQQASYSNLDEVSAGAIAAVRGSYDSVRVFGSMMVSDHGNAQAELDSIGLSLNVTLPNEPDSVHKEMAAQLQTLSGNVFDTTYIGAQVRDHILTIQIFQQELSNGNNQQVKNYANKYLPVIQMHLQEAQNIQTAVQ
jgi:putative membrane protein